ncbi:MAG: phosphoglucosamine mutase [Pseudomonadales bacterium]|nr:phosphoglucosamine mutase [Pseudomonadales bacterium]
MEYFGTDGIRGKVGELPMTPGFCLDLGWAAGKFVAEHSGSLAIIGKDTRISGYLIESVLEAGMVSAGINVGLLGPQPTPAVAHLMGELHADLGLVISASHNPYTDNGIKFFLRNGSKLAKSDEARIERWLREPIEIVEPGRIGKAQRIDDAQDRYVEFCKSTMNQGVSLAGLSVVVDCAHGAGYRVAPRVFEELGATVHTLANEPDGLNINVRCGSTDTRALRASVASHAADVGIALDGDADRALMVDREGDCYDGDDILFVIAASRLRQGRLSGGVVGTTMSNSGLERALGELDIPFVRSDVGDRNVSQLVAEKGWHLGGETSGHVLCRDHVGTGDGIVASLQVVGEMASSKKTLRELTARFVKVPQVLLNIPVANPRDSLGNGSVQNAIKELERVLDAEGRVLVRQSGTESMVRVMVEHHDAHAAESHATRLANTIDEARAGVS